MQNWKHGIETKVFEYGVKTMRDKIRMNKFGLNTKNCVRYSMICHDFSLVSQHQRHSKYKYGLLVGFQILNDLSHILVSSNIKY